MKHFLIGVVAVVWVLVSGRAPAEDRLPERLFQAAKTMEHSRAPGETAEAYEARLRGMTSELARVARAYSREGWNAWGFAVALLRVWNEESKFDQRIHAGLQHPTWSQDGGKAHCMGQIHVSKIVPMDTWERMVGTDEGATALCAEATAKVWVSMARQCGVWANQPPDKLKVAKVFAAYGTGGNCTPTDSALVRAEKWQTAVAAH